MLHVGDCSPSSMGDACREMLVGLDAAIDSTPTGRAAEAAVLAAAERDVGARVAAFADGFDLIEPGVCPFRKRVADDSPTSVAGREQRRPGGLARS